MANQTITQLPAAGAITGTELVPIVQNGATVQTTTGAIAASPAQTQTFITVNNEPSLNNSRYLTTTGSGINTTDGGPQSTLALSLTTPLQSLNTAGTGVMVKTGGGTILPRSIAAGTGLAVTDGDGVAANPTVSASGILLSLAASSGTAILARTSGGSIQGVTLQGTAGEIDVTDGAGPSNPTMGLADNAVLPGTEGVVVPQGSTAQRSGSPTNGTFRYNNSLGIFEGYFSGTWGAIPAGLGVSSVTASTGLTSSPNPITSTGTISVATNGITDALLRQSSGLSVIGRSANSTGDVADIAAASDHQVLRRSGSTVGFGAVNLAQANATTGTLPVTSGGTGQTTYANGELLIGNSTGNTLTKATLTAGSNVTITNAAGSITIASSNPGGTVTSVGLSLPAEFTVTNSPITGSGTLTGAWASAPQAYFFAGPAASTGTPTFRAIAVSDVPTLNQNTSGNAATATTATNVAGGAANQLVFNTGAGATSFAVAPTVANTFLEWSGSAFQWSSNPLGTVTSVGASFTGGIVSISGSPVTTSGTLGFTVAGTSGGIPYFSSSSGWASSGVLAANALVVGGGAGATPATVTTGTGVVTALGVNTGTAGAFVVNGGALGTPASGTVTNLTGTASININGTVGATAANTGAFTTVAASGVITSTVATGTAPFTVASTTQVANLNVATAGTATNVAGGAAGSLVYQTGAATTSTLALGTRGYVLRAGASAPEWAVIDGGTF